MYKDIDKDNQHTVFKIPDKLYYMIRDYILSNFTVLVYDKEGILVDDNI